MDRRKLTQILILIALFEYWLDSVHFSSMIRLVSGSFTFLGQRPTIRDNNRRSEIVTDNHCQQPIMQARIRYKVDSMVANLPKCPAVPWTRTPRGVRVHGTGQTVYFQVQKFKSRKPSVATTILGTAATLTATRDYLGTVVMINPILLSDGAQEEEAPQLWSLFSHSSKGGVDPRSVEARTGRRGCTKGAGY